MYVLALSFQMAAQISSHTPCTHTHTTSSPASLRHLSLESNHIWSIVPPPTQLPPLVLQERPVLMRLSKWNVPRRKRGREGWPGRSRWCVPDPTKYPANQGTDQPLFGSYISEAEGVKYSDFFVFADRWKRSMFRNTDDSNAPVMPHATCTCVMCTASALAIIYLRWISSFRCGGKWLVGMNLSG